MQKEVKMFRWFNEEERNNLQLRFNLNPNTNTNPILDEYMKRIRQKRPMITSDNMYELYHSSDLIQIWFQSPPCRFSQMGKCVMCNYGKGRQIPDLMKTVLQKISIPEDCPTILINTCGSCLDPLEIPEEDLLLLLKWLKQRPTNTVIFETHWTTLNNKVLSLIRSSLPDKKIMYEIGIESTNPDSLLYLLNKPSSLVDVGNIIKTIHNHQAFVIMNVIFGIPFLSPEEQMADAVNSIRDLLNNGSDYIVLFPVNIIIISGFNTTEDVEIEIYDDFTIMKGQTFIAQTYDTSIKSITNQKPYLKEKDY